LPGVTGGNHDNVEEYIGCMIERKTAMSSEGCGHDLERGIVLELAEWSDKTSHGLR